MWAGNCMMITVYELIGSAVGNFLSGQLSGLVMGSSQQQGFNPYGGMQPETTLQALSGFGRARRTATGYQGRVPRGMRPR